MPLVKELTRSFAGGEITPEMWGRLDNVKFQTGLALCRNALVLPHGPVTKRPGTAFVNFCNQLTDTAYKVRLIPFQFSATDTIVLEIAGGDAFGFGSFYIRFHTQGGTLLEATRAITGITQANPGVVTSTAHGYTTGDWVYIADVGGMTQLNGRYYQVEVLTANTFKLKDTITLVDINTTSFSAYTSGGTAARVYQIAAPWWGIHLFELDYTQSADVVTFTHPSYNTRELRRVGATNWTLTAPTLGTAVTAPGTPSVAVVAGTGTAYNKTIYYKVTTVTADGLEESLPSASANGVNDLTLPGARNTVSWGSVGAGVSYRVYKALNTSGRLYGYIGETTDLSFVDDNVTPDYSRNPPSTTIRLDTSGNRPATVSYYEQRRMFAGTTNNPQTIYGSKTGTESNFTTTIPSAADDALSFTIKAQQWNAIRHLVPMADLIALTAGGAWKISSNNNEGLSPSSISVRTQTNYGSNYVHPLLTGISCLYVEANGRRVRDLSFEWQSQVYSSSDRAIMAPHLFLNYTLVDAAYSRSPDQLAWFVRSDGVLLCMTYVPEHQVFGWHQHTTDGTYESVCVVTENNEDVLYAIVRRTINGTVMRSVERMATRLFNTQGDAYFVDCGASYYKSGTFTRSGTTMTCTMVAGHGFVSGSSYSFWFSDGTFGTSAAPVTYTVTVVSPQVFTITVPNTGATSGTVTQSISTVRGLYFLEGESVVALADGAVVRNLTVTNGQITLPTAASKIHVGLPYTTDIQTLPMTIESMMAGGQGTMKSIDYAYLRVYRTGIVKVGPSSTRLTTIPPRTNEPYDTPPRLRSEVLDLLVNPEIDQDAQLWIQSSDPTPLTVSALTTKVSTGG